MANMASSMEDRAKRAEAAEVARRAAAIERELDTSLRRAHARTRRAIASVAAEQRDGDRRSASAAGAARAWARAPRPTLANAIARVRHAGPWAKVGRPEVPAGAARLTADGKAVSTFHFKLHQTYSTGAAKAHQKYIERETACVASFGTLADTYAERERIWQAIGDRSHGKRGTIQIDFTDDPDLAARVIEHVPQWLEEELLTEKAARAVAARARRTMQSKRAGAEHDEPDEPEPEEKEKFDRATYHRSKKDAPKDAVVLWTENVDAHAAMLKNLSEWVDDEEQKARVKTRKPRSPIIQRRMVLELAHEIDDEARERALRRFCERIFGDDVAWHACIHSPENDNDARNFHAYVVYTQFAPEREPHHARWTFEDENSVPSPAHFIKVMSANQKVKGTSALKFRNELIRDWRAAWADIQNEELDAVGANKVYDPRSYRDQGRPDLTPGKHRGTAQSAMERREDVAVGTPTSSEAEWDRLAAIVADALAVEDTRDDTRETWAQCLPEPVRDAFESARLANGLEDTDDELREALRERLDTLSAREVDSATEREREAARWMRGLRDASDDARAPQESPDVERWERIERTVLDESERARRAQQIVVSWSDAEVRDTDGDPRPKVRRLRAAARQSALTQRRWRSHLADLRERVDPAPLDDETIATLLSDLREAGVSLIAAFGRDEARALAAERAMSRTEKGLRRIAHQVRSAEPNERCQIELLSLKGPNLRALRLLPEADHDALVKRIDVLSHAIDLRARLARAAANEAPRPMMKLAQDIATLSTAEAGHNITQAHIDRHRAALALLPESERNDITRAALDAATVLAAHRARARLAGEVTRRLGTPEQRRDDPARIDALAIDEPTRGELARVLPALAREVDQQVHSLSRRRVALNDELAAAEDSAKEKPQHPGKGLERLSHPAGAELLGADTALIARDHPAIHATLVEHTRTFTRATARAITKIERDEPGESVNFRIAHLCSQGQRRAMRAALAKGNETIERIEKAIEEERLATRRLRFRIHTLTESLALDTDVDADDEATRARRERLKKILEIPPGKRREQVRNLLSCPLTVERLPRPKWVLAVRRVGRFGSPKRPANREPPTDSAPPR